MKSANDKACGIARFRSFVFDVLFGIWTALFALGIPAFWVFGAPQRPIRAVTRFWARGTLLLLQYIVGLSYVIGKNAHGSDGPYLIASNHQSPWETLAVLVIFPNVAIVAKNELLRIPVVSWYLAHSPMIIIDREAGSAALKRMLTQSLLAIKNGRSVLIFPEGSRKSPDEPIAFRRGVELLYARLAVPVVPMVVNSGRFWGPSLPYKRPGRIEVSLLPLIHPSLVPAEFSEQLRSAMEDERSRTSDAAFAWD